MLSKIFSQFSKKLENNHNNDNNIYKQYKDLDEIIVDNLNYHITIDIKPPIINDNNNRYIENYKNIYLNRYHEKLIMK